MGQETRAGLSQGAGGEAYLNLILSSVYMGQHVLMLCVCGGGEGRYSQKPGDGFESPGAEIIR